MKASLVLVGFALAALALAVPPAAAFEDCAGLDASGTCTGAYVSCPEVGGRCNASRIYACVGIYDGTTCTGVQKP